MAGKEICLSFFVLPLASEIDNQKEIPHLAIGMRDLKFSKTLLGEPSYADSVFARRMSNSSLAR